MPDLLRRGLLGAAVLVFCTACGGGAIAVSDEEPVVARKEVSAEAVQRVLEGNLAKAANRRADQLAALEAAVAADRADAGLRMAYAEALFLSDKPEEARLELKVAAGLGAAAWELVLVEFPYLQRKGSVADTAALFERASNEGAPERFFVQWRQVAGRAGADSERTACRAWTAAFPNQPNGWGCLGEVERREGRMDASVNAYLKAADAGSEAHTGALIDLLAELGRTPERLEIGLRVAGRFRSSISVAVLLAKLQRGPDGDGTAEACKTLASLAGQIGGNGRRYAEALERVRSELRLSEVRCFVGEALATRGRNEAMVLASAGAFEAAGSFDDARPLLERVVEIDPSNALALNQLGYSLAERNIELAKAVGYLERAVRLRPEDGGILDSLAWAYFRQGRFAEAESLSRQAIELAGAGAVLVDHLGDILWALGKKEEAIERWQFAYQNATSADEDVRTTVPDKLIRAGRPLEEAPDDPEGDGYEEEGEE